MDSVKYIFNKIIKDCRSRAVLFMFILILVLWFVDYDSVEHFENENNKENDKKKESSFPLDLYMIDVGENSIVNSKCSKTCCGQQYPTSFDSYDEEICQNRSKYLPINITCRSDKGVGCLCVTQEQINFLSNRGNNI